MKKVVSGWAVGEESRVVPSPSPVTLFFCKVIAFTPVGDLGRFNHTISTPGQLNQIGQINSGYTGEGFTSLLVRSLFLSVSVTRAQQRLSCSPVRLGWHSVVLTKLNSRVRLLLRQNRGRTTETILKIDFRYFRERQV